MFSNRSRIANSLPFALLLVISLVLPLALGSTTGSTLAASLDEPPVQGEPITPLQEELAKAINQRHSAGLPVPSVSFGSQFDGNQGSTEFPQLQSQSLAAQQTSVTATTIIYFDEPQEAGYDEWPAQEISGNLAGNESASFSSGDFTEGYRAAIEKQMPGFWQQVEFGHEAREYRLSETIELTSPSNNPQLAANLRANPEASIGGDILMGFTFTGPHIAKYFISEASACLPWWLGGDCLQFYYLKAGFELDWALGLRLPASVSLTGPDQAELGTNTEFQTQLAPQDWDGSKYSAYGVAPEGSNEFVLRFTFFAGVLLEVLGEEICPLPAPLVCNVNLSYDASDNFTTSFTTPFGTGSSFPIPTIVIPVYELDLSIFYFSTSLTITPLLTSTNITADWKGSGDCSGSGTVTYSEPGKAEMILVPVCNLDPNNDQAQVELSNFRYYFNSFQLQLGARVSIDVFGVYSDTFDSTIFTLDLSPIFGSLGLYLGDHMQCSWDDSKFPPYVCSRVGPSNSLVLTTTTKDETPPLTNITLPPIDGANGWYVSDVQLSLSADDPCGSGVDKTEYSLDSLTWTPYLGPVMLTTDGVTTVSFRSTDKSGNLESTRSQVVMIDKTPPVITGAPTIPANEFGWWNTGVVIHFDATDAASGIAFVTPDVTISSEGENQSVMGTAIDMAGNLIQLTVGDINIDKTPPVVVITSPLPQTYNNTASFNVQWLSTDSLSGINTEDGDLDGIPVSNGQLVELLLVQAGDHMVSVSAEDKASNYTTTTVDFFVQVDFDGLIASVEYMCQIEWIQSHGICNSLLSKLNNARQSVDRGQCSVAENVLNSFIYEVETLRGRWLTDQAANVSITNALFVIENLSCTTGVP